jgi:hypothetical protein
VSISRLYISEPTHYVYVPRILFSVITLCQSFKFMLSVFAVSDIDRQFPYERRNLFQKVVHAYLGCKIQIEFSLE